MNSNNKDLVRQFNDFLRLSSNPVAIKLHEDETLPDSLRKPVESFGYQLALCQGISLARNLGWSMGFKNDDHSCPVSQVLLGLIKEPEGVTLADVLFPKYCETPEICASTQMTMPRLPLDKYKSISIVPLSKADYEPDVILIYGNPAQISRLLHGGMYHNGAAITSTFLGRASCISEVVVPFLTQRCHVILPGSGERAFASTQDHELCFAFPYKLISKIVKGLETTHKLGTMRFPTPAHGMRLSPKLPEKYFQLRQ